MSQTAQILQHLQRGASITPLEALGRYGVMRLAARIRNLKDQGERINTRIIHPDNGKHFAEYSLCR